MKTYGFDIDGVIARMPWFAPTRKLQRMAHYLFEKRFIWKLYNRYWRMGNSEVFKAMRELARRGVRIVIISGNPEWRREGLEAWFKKRCIPYDRMILAPSVDTDVKFWKSEIVEKEGCDYYLEDRPEIVAYINKRTFVGGGKCRAICYRGQRSDEILKVLAPNAGTFLFLREVID